MKKIRIAIISSALAAFSLAGFSVEAAKPEKAGTEKPSHWKKKKQERFSDEAEKERFRLREHLDDDDEPRKMKEKKKHLPYGLQQKVQRGGELPPGWQTKLKRGEVLGPELRGHSVPLSESLARKLPPLEEGSEYRRIGDKVVRVVEGNGTIVDVIDIAAEVMLKP